MASKITKIIKMWRDLMLTSHPTSGAKDRPTIPKSPLEGGYLTFCRALPTTDIPLPPSDI